MSCTVEDRNAVQSAARAIRDAAPTDAVDVLSPEESHLDGWTLDAVVPNAQGIPPEVLRELALAGLTLRPAPSNGEYQHVLATA